MILEGKVEWGYHVTYEKNLAGIAHNGLVPFGAGSNWNSTTITNHSKKGVFFSTKQDALKVWMSIYSLIASEKEDAVIGGDIPVILKFRLNVNKRHLDPEAIGIAGKHSWYYPSIISPEGILLWSGANWIPVKNYDKLDVRLLTNPGTPKDNEPELWSREVKLSKDYPMPSFREWIS